MEDVLLLARYSFMSKDKYLIADHGQTLRQDTYAKESDSIVFIAMQFLPI